MIREIDGQIWFCCPECGAVVMAEFTQHGSPRGPGGIRWGPGAGGGREPLHLAGGNPVPGAAGGHRGGERPGAYPPRGCDRSAAQRACT